jgi:small nuclear ribonucleoprotein (snRNP)-like protein
VLLYGKTTIDPFYEYFLILDSPIVSNISSQGSTIILDTLLHNHTIRLIGKSLDQDTVAFKADMSNIFNSIHLGPGYRKDISTVMDAALKYRGSNRFIEAYEEIKTFPAYDESEEWLKLQMQLTYASFLDNHYEYDRLINRFAPASVQDSLSQLIKQNLIPAAKVHEEITEQAKLTNLVMVNENHFMPQHRKFVFSLLPALRAIGYRYIALEALGYKQDSLLNLEGGFPTLDTGFYTREQHFANLLRYAKALGFEFVAYESEGSMERELGQAQNLYNKTFGLDKNAKVLVLAGIDHILEQPTENGKKWLGALLHEKYNIDPLTISQTHLSQYRRSSKEEISLVEGKYFKGRLKSVDYHLFNNLSLSSINEKEANFHYKNHYSFPVQLTFFLAEELEHEYDYGAKVPVHAIYLRPNEKIALKLPAKSFYQIIFDSNGKEIENKAIDVLNKTSKQ